MPAASLQLLNWAKYECLHDWQCTEEMLPPWARPTFFSPGDPELEALALGTARCWYTKVPPPECNDGRFNRTDFDSTLYNAADWSDTSTGNPEGNRGETDADSFGDSIEDITKRLRHNVRHERGDTMNPWARMDNVSRRWYRKGLTVSTAKLNGVAGRHATGT